MNFPELGAVVPAQLVQRALPAKQTPPGTSTTCRWGRRAPCPHAMAPAPGPAGNRCPWPALSSQRPAPRLLGPCGPNPWGSGEGVLGQRSPRGPGRAHAGEGGRPALGGAGTGGAGAGCGAPGWGSTGDRGSSGLLAPLDLSRGRGLRRWQLRAGDWKLH